MPHSWPAAREAIRLAVAGAIGLADKTGADDVTTIRNVEWENRRDAAMRWDDTGVTVDLRLGDIITKGTDEIRYEYDADSDRQVPTYTGYRLFTTTVFVTSTSQEPGEAAPDELAGRLRTRLRAQRFLDLTQAANVALVWIGNTLTIDGLDIDGRMQSVAAVDVRWAFTESWTDMDDAGDYIQEVQGVGTLTNPAGDDITVPFVVTAEGVIVDEIVVTDADEPVVTG